MDDLEQRLQTRRERYESIYSKALGGAAIGIAPAAFNMAVDLYNSITRGYNAVVGAMGIERLIAEYSGKPFTPEVITVSTSLALASAAVGLAYMIRADAISAHSLEDGTEHRDGS